MVKKKSDDSHSVPAWVVTFGDMMSLLLCFFILLQMFSELKQDREYQRVVTAIKEAFGYAGGIGVLPVNDPPLRSLVEVLETMAVQHDHEEINVSATENQDVSRKIEQNTRLMTESLEELSELVGRWKVV